MRILALIAAGLALASCGGGGGGGDDGNPTDPSVWHFRGVNLVADSPQVQFYVDDTAVAKSDYGAATDYKPAHTGERPVKVALLNPSDLGSDDPGYEDFGNSETYDFQGPTDYTLVEAGTVAAPRQFLITDTSREAVEDNKVEYQIINAAVGAGTVDAYITAPGAGIDTSTRIGTLEVGEYTDKTNLDLEIPSGGTEDTARSSDLSIQIRSGSSVIFESNTVGVGEQTRLLIIIADNVGAVGASPVKVLVLSGTAASAATVLLNRADPGELRLANVSSDSLPLDYIVGDTAADLLATNVAFGTASAYEPRPPTNYNTIGTPAGNPGVFSFVAPVAIAAGRSYTMYAQGPVATMRGILFGDDRRSVPSEARFRFLNAAASLGGDSVNVYIVQRDADFDLDATSPPSPRISSLAYRGVSAQQVLASGHYDVYFTKAASTDILQGPITLNVQKGSVQTLVLADFPNTRLGLVHINDARE